MFKAQFALKILEDVFVIYDLNRGAKSVTNDIENVLNRIREDEPDLASKKIIYRDSMGVFDGIDIDEDGEFKGFYAINTKTLEDALKKIRRK